jgi:hypothetical protein
MIPGSMHTTENSPGLVSALNSRLARAGRPAVVAICTFLVVYGYPVLAFAAQTADEEGEVRDARLEGYTQKVAMDTGGMGLTWLGFILLAVIGVSALFKSAKRSHLD